MTWDELALPADRPRPFAQDTAGARVPVDLGPQVSSLVAERARALGITPFTFLLGAFALTLSRWTGARSLLTGIPLDGKGTPELVNSVGDTEDVLPVRIDVDDARPAAEYLRSVRASLLSGSERSGGVHPVVQVCFGMYDWLDAGDGDGGVARFDLSVMIGRSGPSLAGYAEYASSLWSAAEAAGFVADFQAAAAELGTATGPAAMGTPLEEVRCLSSRRLAVLDEINDTSRDFPAASLGELFIQVARRWPTAVAVRDPTTELTYAELTSAAAEQACLLREAGVHAGDTVLVGVERSVAEVVAVLGTVLAGAAYVGIDLGQPHAHIGKVVAKSRPAAVLAGRDDADQLRVHGVPVALTWEPARPAAVTGAVPSPPAGPGHLAYVAITSGSTGEPKAVAIPHRAVIRLVHQADYVRLGPGERVLRLSPLAFDASTFELWGAVLTGATLEVCPAGLLSPSELGAFMKEREVTVAWLTAGLFRLVVEFAPDALAGLRQLLTGGDVVPHEHVARALSRHPGLVITNGYGPTENTTFTAVYSVTKPEDIDGPLPIGTPVPGTRVYVLDERGRQVPPGAVGELYVGGAGLADGYLGDEAGTARCFGYLSPDVPERLYRTGDMVRIDSRGRLRFLGRSDDQVKVCGYRIELSAISDTLTACPGVRDAVVTVVRANSADKRILAAVVPEQGAAVLTAELRDHLAESLPSYMVPALWAVVDHVPVTANGKVDRRALAAVAGPAAKSRRR